MRSAVASKRAFQAPSLTLWPCSARASSPHLPHFREADGAKRKCPTDESDMSPSSSSSSPVAESGRATVSHRIHGRTPLERYSLFVEPHAWANLPRECCAVSVSSLFRELLFRLATRPARYDVEGADARLVAVVLDE